MTLSFVYYSPTTPGAEGWSETIAEGIALGRLEGLMCEAELGACATSSVQIEDPLGTAGHSSDAIVGLKQFAVSESLCPEGRRRIFTGYTGDRRYRRDLDRALINGPARLIDVTVVDLNSFLSFRILDDFDRPAETDLARVAALLAVDFLSTTLYDEGLVEASGGVAMDACDYTKQRPADVLNDCAQQSGRNYFVAYNESTGHYQLAYFKSNTSTLYEAICSFSNVPEDIDNSTCFGPSVDAELVRDPSRVISGVWVDYEGGSVYVTLPSTSWTYGWRDGQSPSTNLKTWATAKARGTRYLNDNDSEDDKITFEVDLPADHVNDWREGERGLVRFQHLPGYETAVYVRCLNRTVKQVAKTRAQYRVHYEMSPQTAGEFQQVVLTADTPLNTITPSGTYDLLWTGATTAHPPGVDLEPIIQDTDGFAQIIPEPSLPHGYYVKEVMIPAGRGGTYDLTLEGLTIDTPWLPIYPDTDPSPLKVPYVPSHQAVSVGPGVAEGTQTVTYAIVKNGTDVIASVTYTRTAGLSYIDPAANIEPTSVVLEDGDRLKATVTFGGDGWATSYVYDRYGAELPAFLCGVWAVTRTGDAP